MNIKNLASLNESLVAALKFFQKNPVPKFLKLDDSLKIVVGSGNAYNTGKIIFKDQIALFASESDFKEKLKSAKNLISKALIKDVVIISASGEKDAVWEVKEAKKHKLNTILMTCSPNSTAAKLADETIVYEKIPEPQTYNISTYLGMILSKTKEDPKLIEKFVKSVKLPNNFKDYRAYSFILPDEFVDITPMLDIKKHELFGHHVSIRSFSFGEARHAKFVMPSKDELVISLGENKYFGLKDHRFQIKMPKKFSASLVMALTYYIIGKIQESKPAYYKKNIAEYCKQAPLAYGQTASFPIIVE